MRNWILLSTAVILPAISSASAEVSTDTHTNTPIELKPISQISGTKFASVCFLGVGDCSPNIDYSLDNDQMCRNEGFVSSCPSGQKLQKDKRCAYNSSFGTCCSEKCPDNSATTCGGSVVADDGCGYSCRSCDPCPGYYDCGGTWQYCTGTTCYKDSSRCSVFCKSDYFPNKCNNKSDCKGIYRNGYCSADCTPACVENCYGDSSPKTGDGWTYSTCTTCSGQTLYINSAQSCPSGYSTTVDSCNTTNGYRLITSGKSGNSVCGKCTNSGCPDGYDTFVKTCSAASGYVLETNGVSGGQTCGKCVPTECPDGYSTDVTSCPDAYSLKTSGKSDGKYCRKCECSLTTTSCSAGYEPTLSCVKNGNTYYKCEHCTRSGGSAEGYKTCSGNSNPTGALECGSKTYYQDCGCQGYDANLYKCADNSIGSYTDYTGNICEIFQDGIDNNDACYENGQLKTFKNCTGYVCANGWECDSKATLVPSSSSFIGYTCSGGEASGGFHRAVFSPTSK